MVGAEPIVARDDRAQPIRTREAWRTPGGAGRVRTRPLAARWPTPSSRACRSHAGSQTPGTGHLPSWQTVPSHPANFLRVLAPTGVLVPAVDAFQPGLYLSLEAEPMVGAE